SNTELWPGLQPVARPAYRDVAPPSVTAAEHAARLRSLDWKTVRSGLVNKGGDRWLKHFGGRFYLQLESGFQEIVAYLMGDAEYPNATEQQLRDFAAEEARKRGLTLLESFELWNTQTSLIFHQNFIKFGPYYSATQ
ncbi:MAG: hypothetical protein WBA28_01320, partial [Microbacteriaceae bacterium]